VSRVVGAGLGCAGAGEAPVRRRTTRHTRAGADIASRDIRAHAHGSNGRARSTASQWSDFHRKRRASVRGTTVAPLSSQLHATEIEAPSWPPRAVSGAHMPPGAELSATETAGQSASTLSGVRRRNSALAASSALALLGENPKSTARTQGRSSYARHDLAADGGCAFRRPPRTLRVRHSELGIDLHRIRVDDVRGRCSASSIASATCACGRPLRSATTSRDIPYLP